MSCSAKKNMMNTLHPSFVHVCQAIKTRSAANNIGWGNVAAARQIKPRQAFRRQDQPFPSHLQTPPYECMCTPANQIALLRLARLWRRTPVQGFLLQTSQGARYLWKRATHKASLISSAHAKAANHTCPTKATAAHLKV
jgi:hypothetical protein